LSPVMGTSQERRPCRESNATWTGPLSEAMPACRGRRADHAQKDRVGTWEIPRLARAIPLLARIGKGKPIADDERTREVGPGSSSCEAGEQGGAIRRGAGGAKGWDQGECEPATLGPDAEPGNRVTGAGAHTSNRKNSDSPSLTRGRSRMRESRTYGSGAARLAAVPAGASPANRGVQSLL
jgi:hypothetical protein